MKYEKLCRESVFQSLENKPVMHYNLHVPNDIFTAEDYYCHLFFAVPSLIVYLDFRIN